MEIKSLDDITMTMKLGSPVKLGETVYEELRLREPTVGENDAVLQTHGQSTGANIELVSRVCGVPVGMVRQMSRGDFLRALDFFDSVTAFIRAGALPPGSGAS